MYFFDAIKYPFNSQGVWGKIGMAFLLVIIPIVNIFGAFVLTGYGLKIMSSVMHGDENLPEFEMGADFMRGLTVFIVALIYQIPTFILSFLVGSMGNSGLTLILALVLVVVSIIIAFLLIVALIRYATSGDTGVFMAVGENFGYLSGNPGAAVMFIVNAILFGIVVGIIVTIGFILLVIPGIILSIASLFSAYYLYARFGMELGISEKAKAYTS